MIHGSLFILVGVFPGPFIPRRSRLKFAFSNDPLLWTGEKRGAQDRERWPRLLGGTPFRYGPDAFDVAEVEAAAASGLTKPCGGGMDGWHAGSAATFH